MCDTRDSFAFPDVFGLGSLFPVFTPKIQKSFVDLFSHLTNNAASTDTSSGYNQPNQNQNGGGLFGQLYSGRQNQPSQSQNTGGLFSHIFSGEQNQPAPGQKGGGLFSQIYTGQQNQPTQSQNGGGLLSQLFPQRPASQPSQPYSGSSRNPSENGGGFFNWFQGIQTTPQPKTYPAKVTPKGPTFLELFESAANFTRPLLQNFADTIAESAAAFDPDDWKASQDWIFDSSSDDVNGTNTTSSDVSGTNTTSSDVSGTNTTSSDVSLGHPTNPTIPSILDRDLNIDLNKTIPEKSGNVSGTNTTSEDVSVGNPAHPVIPSNPGKGLEV